MPARLTTLELDLLRKLVNGEAVPCRPSFAFDWRWRASFGMARRALS